MDPLHPDHGLVFRSFIYLFEELKKRDDDATFVIKASYLEIYNEKVRRTMVLKACCKESRGLWGFMIRKGKVRQSAQQSYVTLTSSESYRRLRGKRRKS